MSAVGVVLECCNCRQQIVDEDVSMSKNKSQINQIRSIYQRKDEAVLFEEFLVCELIAAIA